MRKSGRIQSIDNRWNHYNVVNDETKLVHFSHVRDQPWKKPSHPYTDVWVKWMIEAMEHGFVTRGDVVKAVGCAGCRRGTAPVAIGLHP